MSKHHQLLTLACLVVLAGLTTHSFAAGDTLLLSEVVVTPTDGEFVEIHNPTGTAIDLSDVYLTDATFAGGGTYYYKIVTGTNSGGGGFYDFHAKFPNGSSIDPGEYQTVALAGSDGFFATYGELPTYELYEDGATADSVPDMVEATSGSINDQGGLTNEGEIVILYSWDGSSDLVQDLDRVIWGDTAEAFDKTGVAIDSIYDADSDTSTYQPDTATASQILVAADAHDFGNAWHRIDMTEGDETTPGGNGATGDDETSENLALTWQQRPPSPNAAAPNPTPFPLLLSEVVATAGHAPFLEIFNPGTDEVRLDTVYIADVGNAYTNMVTGSGAGGGTNGDFNARFPEGATILPGEYQTVAISGSIAFAAEYGSDPTYELYEDGAADGVPEMREAVSGSIAGQGQLRTAGEAVVLYFWNGFGDLIVDLDYVVWGDGEAAVDKTGLSVDGPDGDSTLSAYLDDTPPGSQDLLPVATESVWRTDLTEGAEVTGGGNGFADADETSEDLSNTWAATTATPGSGPDTGWVINEVHSDPDTVDGDANGSGSVDSSEDEFVELANTTGSDQDISGWTLSDSYEVRHVFPAGTIVPADCAVVVFGDGPILANLGAAIPNEASTGLLGLSNAGDTVSLLTDQGVLMATVTYSSALGGANQSFTLDPDLTGTSYVKHSLATGSGGALFSPGTFIDGTPFSGCSTSTTAADIWEIQGADTASPYEYQSVTTAGVVTAVGPNGFFLQANPGDGDPSTSDGLWVQVDAGPSVTVGDDVEVTGQVVEYYGMTEISNPTTVTVLRRGRAVPAPIQLDASTPSTVPQPIPDLERFEGMLVQVTDAYVTGPTNKFGDLAVTAQGSRAFIEPGAVYPGVDGHPEIQVFDGNPEVFEIAPYALGFADEWVPAGAIVSAAGGLQFSYGDYQIWPTSMTWTGDLAARPAPEPELGQMRIASQNFYRLLPSEPDPDVDYATRLDKLARLVVDVYGSPDVLAVQEVETLAALQDVADEVQTYGGVGYDAYLEPGNFGDINIGFLVRTDTMSGVSVVQVGADAQFDYGGSPRDVFSRPPLVLRGTYTWTSVSRDPIALDVTVVALHLRSRGSIETDDFVRQKRWHQAEWLASYLEALQTTDPNIVVVGDYNAFQFSDGLADVLGIMTGDPDSEFPALIPGSGTADPNMVNQIATVPTDDRYSFMYKGSSEALDHALTSPALAAYVDRMVYIRANADTPANWASVAGSPLRAADHDGLVLYVSPVPSGSGVCDVNLVGGCDAADVMEVLHVLDDVSYEPAGNANVDGIGDVTVDDLLVLIGGFF